MIPADCLERREGDVVTATLNLLHGQLCPPVVCQPRGKVFRYLEAGVWTECDELPAHIRDQLPEPEAERCENHRARRGYP